MSAKVFIAINFKKVNAIVKANKCMIGIKKMKQ